MKSFIKSYFKKYSAYIIFTLLIVIINVSSITLIPYLIGKEIDEIALYVKYLNKLIDDFSWIKFEWILIAIIVDIIILVIFQYLFESLLGIFCEKITCALRNEIFSKLIKSNINYIDNHKHGDLISLVINDVDNINTGIQSAFKQFYQGVVQVIITIVVMLLINWILGLIVIFLTPFGFLVSFLVAKNGKKYYSSQAKLVGEDNGIFLEYLNNIETMKAFDYESEFFKKYEIKNNELYKVGQKSQFIGGLTNPTTRLFNNSIYGLIGALGVVLAVIGSKSDDMILGASTSIGIVSTFLQYSNQFAKPFNEISSCVNEMQTALASANRLDKVLNIENEINEGKEEIPDLIDNITFENVSFSYVKNRLILKNINLKIKNGQKVAIVGPTGCGKTTLINLLLRFYDPDSGSIKVNDIDLKDIKKESLRSSFGLVLQDSWIFTGTVFENITYNTSNKCTLEEVKKICESANCLSFIERLPQGFDTIISEDSGLSNGQKQLISIARVMMSEPKIIVLDEATSNIDTRTEAKIIKSLENLQKGRTSFVIAHRLNTIINSDLIIVLKDGIVYECGKHEELLNKKGFYYDLFTSQFEA